MTSGKTYRCEACRTAPARCEACRARRGAKRNALRAERREADLCTECGREAADGMRRCDECADENNLRSAAAHKARRAEAAS